MEAIKLSTVLAKLDEKVLPDGTQKTFSIKFIKKNGELVYYPRCVSTGLNLNLKANAMRGVRFVDRNFDPLDHHTPVYIWSILEFNDNPVILK
ncbi:MAG: hypothetical protein HQ565_08230 [Bacteroidetes bacterium]|nr:hypothetical protein [Bacteroidota bacterium]